MDWQEYQEAVARLYEQADGLGDVRRNTFLPDRTTGQPRQVDVLIEIEAKGHPLRLVIDAKYRRGKINVRHVEEVIALAEAVGANKCVLVAANGWTKPAERKAAMSGTDLILLDIDEALDLVVEDKWELCPVCEQDCIVLDHYGTLQLPDGSESVHLAGQCRTCKLAFLWCLACGDEGHMRPGDSHTCGCGHTWRCERGRMCVQVAGHNALLEI